MSVRPVVRKALAWVLAKLRLRLGKEKVDSLLVGHYLIDAIYYPGSAVLDARMTVFDRADEIPERLTREDLHAMAHEDMIISGDDNNPHGIIDHDLGCILERPHQSGVALARYEDADTKDHHVIWLANKKDSKAILVGSKRCVSVSFATSVRPATQRPTWEVRRRIDHVALLDPTENPPYFEECQVVAAVPIASADSKLGSLIATKAAYLAGVLSRAHAAAPSEIGSPGVAATRYSAAAISSPPLKQQPSIPGDQSSAEHRPAMDSQQTQTQAPAPSAEQSGSNKMNFEALLQMISSQSPDQVSTAKQTIESFLKEVNLSPSANASDVYNAVSKTIQDPSEASTAAVHLLSLISMYNQAESQLTPMDTGSDPTPQEKQQNEKQPAPPAPSAQITPEQAQQVYEQVQKMAAAEAEKTAELAREIYNISGNQFAVPDINAFKNPADALEVMTGVKQICAYSIKAARDKSIKKKDHNNSHSGSAFDRIANSMRRTQSSQQQQQQQQQPMAHSLVPTTTTPTQQPMDLSSINPNIAALLNSKFGF